MRRVILLIGLVVAAAAVYVALRASGLLSVLTHEDRLRDMIDGLGAWGPIAVVALEAGAIVVTPIPSAPIAMVAGAAYGALWGTVYIVLGAEIGAVAAFWIARYFGYGVVRRWSSVRQVLDWLEQEHSQKWLMGVVFATRLVPFISFDAVSYAAGLTPLAFWRFAAATVAGVTPIAFLLVYTGDALLVSGNGSAMWTITALGAVTLLPFAVKFAWERWRRRAPRAQAGPRRVDDPPP